MTANRCQHGKRTELTVKVWNAPHISRSASPRHCLKADIVDSEVPFEGTQRAALGLN
ncbi:hypothetical protein NKI79_32185 [Mesorhizobium sp. M0340]|uniref:hypothetical protein n=1 Tax=Mesorhizobium sp. M0340 TaxID=2956939 RepID=UPI00333BA4F1